MGKHVVPFIPDGTRLLRNAGGEAVVRTAFIPAGVVQVADYYSPVLGDAPDRVPLACVLTLREVELNGVLETDPQRAQALAREAGLADDS